MSLVAALHAISPETSRIHRIAATGLTHFSLSLSRIIYLCTSTTFAIFGCKIENEKMVTFYIYICGISEMFDCGQYFLEAWPCMYTGNRWKTWQVWKLYFRVDKSLIPISVYSTDIDLFVHFNDAYKYKHANVQCITSYSWSKYKAIRESPGDGWRDVAIRGY